VRIVSLLPSATEIVCALGAGSELVGRSAECDHPPSVRGLPIVMQLRTDDTEAPSADIDARVQTVRGRGESLYTLDWPLLGRLRPDVILTQDLCRVCSVTDGEVAEACRAAGISPTIVTLSPERLDPVWASVETIGSAVQRTAAARSLAGELRTRAARPDPPPPGPRPRVAVVEWLAPPILAGLWTPDIILASGGEPVGVAAGGHGVRTTWAALEELHPDLVVVSPCSFSVDRTKREARDPAIARGMARLRPSLGTWLVDEAYFSRPGPRLADGVDLLRTLLRRELPPTAMSAELWRPTGAGV
jgi:iron complex transport system substrate-binding protein